MPSNAEALTLAPRIDYPRPRIIYNRSDPSWPLLTGVVGETELLRIPIRPLLLGLNGRLRIWPNFIGTGAGGSKSGFVRFGNQSGLSGTQYGGASATASMRGFAEIIAQQSHQSQSGGWTAGFTALTTSTLSEVSSTFDLTQWHDIVISGSVAVAADTLRLRALLIELYPEA